MGRPRVKIIDDSQLEEEKTSTRPSSGGKKTKKAKSDADKVKRAEVKSDEASKEEAKLESVKANGEAEQTTEPVIAIRQLAEKQSSSENDQTQIATSSTTKVGTPRNDKNTKPQKPGKAKPRSKKYQEVVKDLDRTKTYPLGEAVNMAKKMSYSKINATLEAHINTAQTGIRGLVSLPYASGRQLRILAFGPSQTPKLEGVIFGSDEAIEEIKKGKLDFDLIITTPDWMPKLAKVARILGPRGLMPNPKNGTIVSDLKKAVESFQAGKTEYEHSSKILYKTESKAPVIHMVMGKLNQPTEELSANIKTLLQTLGKTKVKKLTLSPTMGPGVKVDLASL